MYVQVDTSAAVAAAVASLDVQSNEVALILVGQETSMDPAGLIDALRETGIRFFGGLFPGLVDGDVCRRAGAVVTKFPIIGEPQLLRHLGGTVAPIQTPTDYPGKSRATVFTIFDGLSAGIANFVERLYASFGQSVRYFGGGAGKFLGEAAGPFAFEQIASVFTSDGWFADAAVVCLVDQEAQLGICHGWQTIAGPFVATRTEGPLILELDFEPAYDVYRRVVEADCGAALDKDRFFDTARRYPFGVIKEDGDNVVRLVAAAGPNDSLACGADVFENSAVEILRGDRSELLSAAEQAVSDSLIGQRLPSQVIVWDCVSRWLILGDDFGREIGAIQRRLEELDPEARSFGVLSLGELASDGNRVLEFLNKTVVTASFYPSTPD